MVKIRLARGGAKKKPIYRVVVAPSQNPRDGRFIEKIGQYDPNHHPVKFTLDKERYDHWVGTGAQPSVTLKQLVSRMA